MPSKKQIRYKDAGVNIDEADRAVALIKSHAGTTFTRGVLTDIGTFGAGFRLAGFQQPVLVSSADGVGTKLKIAFLTGRHNTVGEDLVHHCVNDIGVQGARPLFFLDYFATGKLSAEVRGKWWKVWREDAGRTAARSSAEKPRRCPACMRPASMTWPDSSWVRWSANGC